jgi:nitrite reductase/ring-hydroxylating ferredoxin subunit
VVHQTQILTLILPSASCLPQPLDGTLYDIETGAVVQWVPKSGNPVRAILGMLKEKEAPLPLKMYPVQVVESSILVKVR